VWDTAIATIALADAGLSPFHPAMQRAVRWLLDQEVRAPGDWQVRRPGIAPAGWHFEYQNDWYPDIDDSAMVVLALHRAAPAGDPEVRAATRRALDWILAMQNRDGGWAAFDVDITNEILTKVPFADHNAMLDPSRHHGAGGRDAGYAGVQGRRSGRRPGARLSVVHPGA
jgi:squalene-hopene/tetraprenyl-beta-curcumene cyclase